LGLSLMGGGGMLSVAFILPTMGRWYDNFKAAAVATGVSAADADNIASSNTFMKVAIMPGILVLVFILIYLSRRKFYAQHKAKTTAA
jgi:uncharacterized membrane protein YozB (DUF420 family)